MAQVIEQLHAVDSLHRRQRIRRSSFRAFGVITGYLLLQLLPVNQFAHSLQKDFAAGFPLLGLVLCFGEGDLVDGGNEFCAVDDVRIIVDFGD